MRSFKGTIISIEYSQASIHSFNGTVHFSDVKICNHLILPTDILPAYFRAPVTEKQTSYRSSYIIRAGLNILK